MALTDKELIDRLETQVSSYKHDLGESVKRFDRLLKAYAELEEVFWVIHRHAQKRINEVKKSR